MIGRSRPVSALYFCVFVALVGPIATATPVEAALGNQPVLDDAPAATTDALAFGLRGLSNGDQVLVLGSAVVVLTVVTAGLVYRYEPQFGAAHRPSKDGANASEPNDSGRETERSPGSTVDRRRPSTTLTDFERVIRLLEDNDGKLPQSEIVAGTPWSKSKVSRLLTRMSDHDRIVKINAGRQNIIVLPGSEPDELKLLRDGERP